MLKASASASQIVSGWPRPLRSTISISRKSGCGPAREFTTIEVAESWNIGGLEAVSSRDESRGLSASIGKFRTTHSRAPRDGFDGAVSGGTNGALITRGGREVFAKRKVAHARSRSGNLIPKDRETMAHLFQQCGSESRQLKAEARTRCLARGWA